MEINIKDLVKKTAYAGEKLQREDGAFPAGNNGPHGDEETPVRNTSHWLITQCHGFRLTHDHSLEKSALRGLDFLLKEENHPNGCAFLHRISDDKNNSNGLVGQAWTVEALATASKILNRDDAFEIAREIVELHPFNYDIGLWEAVDSDGELLGFHRTFNQQLMFSAAASLLQDDGILEKINVFLDECHNWFEVDKNGVFHLSIAVPRTFRHNIHFLTAGNSPFISNVSFLARREIERSALPFSPLSNPSKSMYERSVGYHSFVLYGFGLLKSEFPNHSLWENVEFLRALETIKSNSYQNDIKSNEYCFDYNPTGFEIAFAAKQFGLEDVDAEWWIREQLNRTRDERGYPMRVSRSDSTTLFARTYEATRLLQ